MYNPQIETFIRATDAGSFNTSAEEAVITFKYIQMNKNKTSHEVLDVYKRQALNLDTVNFLKPSSDHFVLLYKNPESIKKNGI